MSIVARYTSSSLQSSGHVNGEGNRNDHKILRPGSHGSSRLGFHGLCALFIGVKFVVLASFWGLIWYYRSVGFQVLTLDGHCFERTSLFEMAASQISHVDAKWNNSETIYQNCLCETACWWAHPHRAENRFQCWNTCSSILQQGDYVFWRGSDVLVPHLRQIFKSAHDEMRSTWIEQGLPDYFEDLQYYWIARHMDERSAVLNYQSTFSIDLAIMLETNIVQPNLLDTFPDFDVSDDFSMSATMLDTFGAVNIEDMSAPADTDAMVKTSEHFEHLWPSIVSTLPFGTLSDIADLEVSATRFYSWTASLFFAIVAAFCSWCFHVPAAFFVFLLMSKRPVIGIGWNWVKPRGFLQISYALFTVICSCWLQRLVGTDSLNLMTSLFHSHTHRPSSPGFPSAGDLSYVVPVLGAHSTASMLMLCTICVCFFSPVVGVLHYGFSFFGHRMGWCSPLSFSDTDFRNRYHRYPSACGIAEAVSQGVFWSSNTD